MSQFMLVLVLVVVLLPLAVAKLLLDYRSDRNRGSGEITLTVGELERLVRRYVEDATEPLHRRIEVLERVVEESSSGGDVPARDPFPLIDDPSLEEESTRSDTDVSDDSRARMT